MAWLRPLMITLELMLFSSIVAVALGIPIAWLLALCSRRNGIHASHRLGQFAVRFFLVSSVVCLATPLVLHATAWEAAAGKFGWVSLTQASARTFTGLAGRYSGMVASVWIHGLYSASLVALATWLSSRRTPSSVIDQALLEMSWQRMWWKVRLPLARQWIILALLAGAMLAATEMTVVDLYAVRTVADEFYLYHAMDPSLLTVLGTLVLPSVVVIALMAVIATSRRRINLDQNAIYQDSADESSLKSIHATSVDPSDLTSTLVNFLPAILLLLLSSLWTLVPLLALGIKAGHQFFPAQNEGQADAFGWSIGLALSNLFSAPIQFSQEYQWSIVLAIATGSMSCLLGAVLASRARTRTSTKRILDLLSIGFFLIPGPLVGLALVSIFSLPIPGFKTLYQATLVPTIFGLLVRAVPVSYWMMSTAYQGMPNELVDISRMDLPWRSRLWRVDLPLLWRHLIAAGFAAGVFSAGDVPVTLPLLPPGVVTVGTRLFALLHSGARHQEAALAFWYVFVVVLGTVVMSFCWKRSSP